MNRPRRRTRPRYVPAPSAEGPASLAAAGAPPRPAAAQRPLSPEPSAGIPAVFLNGVPSHPLVYRKRIANADRTARAGDLVAVYGPENELAGYGLYNPRSQIGLRMLWRGAQLPDDALWRERLARAVALRRQTLRLDDVADAYRVVHAEGDGLSGLVVDKLGDVLSAEVFSLGMYQRAEAIVAQLAPLCGTRHALIRTAPQFTSQEGETLPEIASPDLPAEVMIQEHGTRFRVRFAGGHKTGFFCDQRENRFRLSQLVRDKTVLDVCTYTGGFAVQAKRLGGAAEVTGVDLDEEPLRLARENAHLNQVRVRFAQADAFDYMREMIENGRRYDVVVLDPPKLVRTRMELEEGTRKHFDLNRLAMQLVAPGGLLLSCCCSGLVAEEDFLRLLVASSRQSGPIVSPATAERPAWRAARSMQILARTGAAADHPVAADCPETEYLKAVWMRLE
jgi:23S rRNA (cytosine1962-C5)-methyltransferase